MVCGGLANSQRKRLGAANQTRPVAVSGCANDFKVRVWMTSADQVWILVCELSQAPRTELAPQAGGCQPKTLRNTHRKLNDQWRMTSEIRSSNVEKLRVAPAGFVIPSDFVIRHSDLRTRAFGYRELHLIARRARASRPDRNEVIPLVEMLSDGSFKSTHDFLGQFVARLARAQSRAVIGYLREDVGGVALVRARQ